ncbi:MAG: tRNA pseudouridine(55) synthase TruB, partial [Chloroflexi bacterium]|nr:tRNA pseudouridine(55) synthase TruB [Chloroflexota bacterium]
AISVGGERLYNLARQGKPVTAPSRTVTIFRLALHAWHPPTLEIDVDCSKGTYIRALARDLGEMLGCFAHMSALRRTRAGPFLLNDALTLDEAVARGSTGTLPELLRPLHAGIPDIPQHVLEHDVVQRVRHGQRVAISAADGLTALLTLDGTLVAVGTVTHGVFQPKRVLAQGEESPTSVSARYGAE